MKVKRWKLAVQEYDFKVHYIPGEQNVVADTFSRLVVCYPGEEFLGVLAPIVRETPMTTAQYELIESVHNTRVGHHGLERTLKKLREAKKTWKYMRSHVRAFISKCPVCQKLSDLKVPIITHPFTTAAYEPMEVLNMDTIGPLAKDEFGNKFILVIIDCFTRFVELYPIVDTGALSAARALLQHIGRYGVPSRIRSDRGPQFVNSTLQELIKLFGSEQELSTSYSKQENGMVERANKEVMRHLRAIVFHDKVHTQWSMNQLPFVQRILNAEEKENTGVSPAELLFGNAVKLSRNLLIPASELDESTVSSLSKHMSDMLKTQARLIEVAQETQLKHDSHHMSSYDPGFTEFPINSYVLFSHPEGRADKLSMTKRGPYRVVNIQGSQYTIQDLVTEKNLDTHISNLSPFNYDPTKTDPMEVAMNEQGQFFVDRILDHRGDKSRRKTMEFLVQWRGLDPSYNTLEPYSELRDNEYLLDYLREHRMTSLINKKHKV
jgi:transposase InsO family protein